MALTATPIRIARHFFTTANTDELIYTVIAPKVIIKEVMLINHNSQDKEISLAVVPQGETLGIQHYIFLNGKAHGDESNIFTGLSLVCETGDTIYVKSSSSDTIINISGVEFTIIPIV